jgi:hypothetical protein
MDMVVSFKREKGKAHIVSLGEFFLYKKKSFPKEPEVSLGHGKQSNKRCRSRAVSRLNKTVSGKLTQITQVVSPKRNK